MWKFELAEEKNDSLTLLGKIFAEENNEYVLDGEGPAKLTPRLKSQHKVTFGRHVL